MEYVHKNCENCGVEFKHRKSGRPKARFCSLSCLSTMTAMEQHAKERLRWSLEDPAQTKLELCNRFYRFIVIMPGCWDWSGSKTSGYGNLSFRGKVMKSHRISWILHHGDIPKNMWVLHKCDNRACSNPEHLFLGNHSDNMRDMSNKGRYPISAAKLKREDVIKIRELLHLGVKMTKISKDYNVSSTAIYYIKHNITWQNIV